jgi:hypothetical protein
MTVIRLPSTLTADLGHGWDDGAKGPFPTIVLRFGDVTVKEWRLTEQEARTAGVSGDVDDFIAGKLAELFKD